MGAMLKSSLVNYPAAYAASVVLICVAALFAAIAVWVLRPQSKPMFDRASRLPLDLEEER